MSFHHTLLNTSSAAPDAPTFMLAHALGCDSTMWSSLLPSLLTRGHVLLFDLPGHGGSRGQAPLSSMPELADEALALLDALGLRKVVWIGLSAGGMIGQELALRHPGRVQALVLANTTSVYPDAAKDGWNQRIGSIRQGGLVSFVDVAMTRWFHDAFRARHAELVKHWRDKVLECDIDGYLAACAAVRDVNTTDRLPGIQVPSLVISGELDLGTPAAMGQVIAEAIPNADFVVLPEASHLSVLEQPERFSEALTQWLDRAVLSA